MEDQNPQKTGIEINVVEWKKGAQEIAIFFHDLDQMVSLTPKSARDMAFLLMECADFVSPPLYMEGGETMEDDDEQESIFGPDVEEDGDEDEDR